MTDKNEKKDFEAFIADLEKRLEGVPKEEIEADAQKIEDFLQGKIGWSDVFNFTPQQVDQMTEMGYSQFKMGRYQEAERFFKVLSVLDFDNFYYHLMLGQIYQKQNRDGEAIVEYTQSLESFSNDTASLAGRGEIFMRHGWIDDAVRDFEKILQTQTGGGEKDPFVDRARQLLDQIKRDQQKKKGK